MELQTQDRERFDNLKKAISEGMAICFIVGAALREIKERQFYLADGYKTFEEFCDGEWGWTKRYCNQLIVDAKAINSLPPGLRSLITSHKAAQELSKIPEMLRAPVVEQATNGGTKPATAAQLRKVAPPRPVAPAPAKAKPATSTPPPRKPKAPTPAVPTGPVDETGLPIPAESLNLWNRGMEAREILTFTMAVRSKLKKFQEDGDPLFVEVDFTDNIAKLSQVILDLERAKPYAICPSCQGKLPTDCGQCKGRGFVSKFYWEKCVPEEVRKMREGGAK